MCWRILSMGILTSWLLAGDVRADDAPVRQTVRVDLKSKAEFILNGGPNGEPSRLNVDSVVSATPPAMLAAVKQWTGIADRGESITVKFIHSPVNSRYVAMSHGDGYSISASVTVAGKPVVEHDTHVRFKEVLSASGEKTFSVLGIHEFENRVTRRKCYVICQIEGEKPASKDPQDAVIHPTGTATWTGPLLNASSVLFPNNDAAGK